MRKASARLLIGCLLALTTMVLVSPAQAIPTYSEHCSQCHPVDADVIVTVRQLAVDGETATYSVEVSSTPGLAGWAVFSDFGKVAYGLKPLGQFAVPVGSTYTLFAVAHQTNHSGSVVIAPAAPSSQPSSTPAPIFLTLAGPATCPYGSADLSATFKDATGGVIAGEPAELQSSTSGSPWSSLSTIESGPAVLSLHVAPKSKTFYRLVFGGDASYEETASAAVVVIPRVRLTIPSAPKRVRRRARFKLKGSISPMKGRGVRVYIYRFRRGTWALRSTLVCKTGGGAYSRVVALSSKGAWRIRTRFIGDAQNAPTWSGYRRISVR